MTLPISFILVLSFLIFSCSKKELITSAPKTSPSPLTPEDLQSEKNITTNNEGDAYFDFISGSVSHKRAQKLTWEDSSKKTPLFLKDWIKTEKNSSASINMTNQRMIKMSENSRLILLERDDQQKLKRAVVGVSEGDITGEVGHQPGEPSELLLKLPHAWLRVKSSVKAGVKKVFQISLNSTEMKIHVSEGELEVINKGKVIKLTKNKVYKKIRPKSKQEKKFDFLKAESPPAELPDNSSPNFPKSKEVKQFSFTYPKNKTTFNQEYITIKGLAPSDSEIIFKGQNIALDKNKFSLKVQLKMGTNFITLQVIRGNSIEYKTMELERK